MFIPRRPLGILLMIVIFLVLTVIAAISYSQTEDGAKHIKEQPWYRLANASWQVSENFFSRLLPNKNTTAISNDLSKNDLPSDDPKNIQIIKNSSSWQLILQNNNEIILDKSWPRLFKIKD